MIRFFAQPGGPQWPIPATRRRHSRTGIIVGTVTRGFISHRFFTATLYTFTSLLEELKQQVKSMKKYRLYIVVALLAAPSILVSSPGFSTSRLPAINSTTQLTQQQNCPVGGGYGCFSSPGASPFSICQQFMQMFLRPRGA